MNNSRTVKAILAIVVSLLTVMSMASCSKKGKDSSATEETKGISANHTDTFNKLTRKEFAITEEDTTTENGENTEGTTEADKYIIEDAPANPEDVVIGEIKDNFITVDDYTVVAEDKPIENMDFNKFGTNLAGLFQVLDDTSAAYVYEALDTIFTEHTDFDPRVFQRVKGVENTEDYEWTIYTISNGPTNIKIAIGIDGVRYKIETN